MVLGLGTGSRDKEERFRHCPAKERTGAAAEGQLETEQADQERKAVISLTHCGKIVGHGDAECIAGIVQDGIGA